MNLFDLIMLGIETVVQLAGNPAFGLGESSARVAALLAVLAKLGRKGNEALPELRSFTDEIKAILAAGTRVDPATWDALTARRHADADAIHAATVAGRAPIGG